MYKLTNFVFYSILRLAVAENFFYFPFSTGRFSGVPEMHSKILTTSYWLHVELGKNIKKILSKNKMTFNF
jgi:hypothetical protein